MTHPRRRRFDLLELSLLAVYVCAASIVGTLHVAGPPPVPPDLEWLARIYGPDKHS